MKVELGTLKDKGEDLVAFLEPRVGTKPTLSSDSLEIEDDAIRQGVKPRHVKTYVKRFLYMNGVKKKYRVFVSGKELTLQEVVTGEEEKKEKEEKASKLAQAEKKEKEEASTRKAKAEEASEAPAAETKEEKPAKKEKPKSSKKTKPKKETKPKSDADDSDESES